MKTYHLYNPSPVHRCFFCDGNVSATCFYHLQNGERRFGCDRHTGQWYEEAYGVSASNAAASAAYFFHGAHPGGIQMRTPTESTCACGRTHYADEGDQCPQCMKQVPHPFLLRDQCGACGLPCSADWCPYCEGTHDGEEGLESARRQFAAAVLQLTQDANMWRDQLELRDRALRATEAARDIALSEAAALRRQRDLARQDRDFEHDRRMAAYDRADRLQAEAAALRRWAFRALVTFTTLLGGGGLSWLWWDSLPGWSPEALDRWRILVSFAIGALGTHLFLRHKKLPGGNPGKSTRPTAPEPTGAGPTPRNTTGGISPPTAEQTSV